MARPGPKPGVKKTIGSGRKKGSINKRTMSAAELLRSLGCDPLRELVQIGNKALKDKDPQLAMNCFKEAATYSYPRLKSVEVNGTIDTKVVLERIIKRFDGSIDADD